MEQRLRPARDPSFRGFQLSVRPGVASPERNRIGERRTAWRKGFHAHGRMEPEPVISFVELERRGGPSHWQASN
jgi:hypothetical protein